MVARSKKEKAPLVFLTVAVFLIAASLAFLYFKAHPPFKRAAGGKRPPTSKALGITDKAVLPMPLKIHEGHGHIVESYKAKEGPGKIIIHIQDIHTNYEAQKNLSNIIEALIKNKGLKLIMVEGGWGDVSLTYLRSYADKERRLEVAEEYLKEGKISGEEYLNIISDYDMDIEGVEKEDLYKKNLDTFFKIENFRQEATQRINQLISIAEALKRKIYPSKLLELEKKHAEYDEEKITLSEFYDYLMKTAKAVGLDASAFYNFQRFAKIAELEEKIDFVKVEKQRANLIEKLSKVLRKDKLTPLVAKSLEFRLNKVSPAGYHTYLKQITMEAGMNLKSYPDLSKYIEYIKSHEEINTNILFKEADLLEKQLKQMLARTEEQGKLQALSRTLAIFCNFLNLKLIPEDFQYYKEHKNGFLISSWEPFLKEEIKKYKIGCSLPTDYSVLDNNLSTLVEFYDIANQRDRIFIEKAISLMDKKKQNLAVLIAGGFHTPTLTKMFKDKDISYIVIAPKTTQKTDPEQYRYILEYKSGRTK